MIAYLQGRIIYKDVEKSLIILEVNGVGYEVYIPLFNNSDNNTGNGVSFFIYTYVREDRITLYGFNTTLQREIFSLLLDVKDVGPKLAVTILSSIDAANFINILTTQDISALCGIKGIGQAKAERIIMELKNKVLKKISLLNDINACDLVKNAGKGNIFSAADPEKHTFSAAEDDSIENAKIISNDGQGITEGDIAKENDSSAAALTRNRLNRQPSDTILESAKALEVLGYSRLDSFNLASKIFGILKANGNLPADTENLTRECLKQIYSQKNI